MATVKKVVKKTTTKKAQVGYSIGMHSTRDAKGNIDRLDRFKNAQGEDRYYRSTGTDIDALGKFNKTKAMLNRADSVRSNTLTPREREVMASQVNPMKNGGKTAKAKSGKQMLKRADGSTSQRGLWDNIRAAKGSGKKPTAAMLKQEKKIKAKTKK